MKEQYHELCKKEKTIPIFLRDYWMDIVSNNWDVLIYEKRNKVLGAFVYVIKSKFGMKYISMPKMTQYNGIWINYDGITKKEKIMALENEVNDYFIEKIKELDIKYYFQSFSTDCKNWLSFYWNKFDCQPNYTYVIEHGNLDDVWSNVTSTLRNEIKKAESNAILYECTDTKEFYSLLEKTYERQSQKPRITYDEYCEFDKVMKKHNSSFVIGAKDKEGNIHSICYFVMDDKKMYYLLSGNDYNYRKSNFNSLLVWEGIKKANELGLDFDFEGSMNKNINLFMRKFGGNLKTYYKIKKVYTKNMILKFLINRKLK